MAVKTTKISVFLDDTVKKNKLFSQVTSIDFNRMELLKYAVLAWEVPDNVKESDFNYLQNKLPALDSYLEGLVEFTSDSIINLSNDDRNKKLISEYLGVGVGLKYTTLLLKISPNRFKKINRPVQGKYLDYSTVCGKREYEIETKGTVGKYYKSMKRDILEKKKSQKKVKTVFLRLGTIFLANNKFSKAEVKSKCVIVDDPPFQNEVNQDDTYKTQLLSYAVFLSQLLDSKYYNKYIQKVKKNRFSRLRIPQNKFYGIYEFEGRRYFGECFDYRLIVNNLKSEILTNKKIREIFKSITEKVGVTKIFVGLDENVLNAINTQKASFLSDYEVEQKVVIEDKVSKFLDKDGILVVKAIEGSDNQINMIFPEAEVERRFSLYINYLKGETHKCGAPCTSRGLEGKPCDKLTFRRFCYFHR